MKTCGVVSENLRGCWWKPVGLFAETRGVIRYPLSAKEDVCVRKVLLDGRKVPLYRR